MAISIIKSINRNHEEPREAHALAADPVTRGGLTVAIPAFNEEVAIGSVVARCKKYADNVVVVDDGSADHTVEVARLVGAVVVSHGLNKGYGAAVRSCFEAARSLGSGALVIIDGDGQHDPDDIPLLVTELKKSGADIVIGSRFIGDAKKQDIPAYRKVGMKVLDMATGLSSGVKVSDSQSGFRAYSAKAIREIEMEGQGMGAGSEILINAADKHLNIAEVPIKARYDLQDTSSENPVKHGFGVLGSILKIASRRQPILFLGVPGAFLLVFCIYLIYIGLSNLAMASWQSMVIMLCMIAGMLGVYTALILTMQRTATS